MRCGMPLIYMLLLVSHKQHLARHRIHSQRGRDSNIFRSPKITQLAPI